MPWRYQIEKLPDGMAIWRVSIDGRKVYSVVEFPKSEPPNIDDQLANLRQAMADMDDR